MEFVQQLLPFVFLIAIMYFIIIRPQQQEAKKHKAMLAALKKGDRVVTNGGFIVVIRKVEDEFLSVEMNKETVVRLSKDAVARKLEDEA